MSEKEAVSVRASCLQALATNPVTCVAVCFDVWCGGDLGKRK